MKKRLTLMALTLAVVVLIGVVFLPIEAKAATEGYYTYTVSNGEATITDCKESTSGAITIPSTLGGCPVTSIGPKAFSYCKSLSSITIPDSVTRIGDSAFYYCRGLTSITIPDSVTSIGDSAFYYCDKLTSITIPDSVTSIGNSAFYYCISLTSITIPDGVTSIGSDAFNYCSSLTSITIPDSVTSIGNSAFKYCIKLTSITLPDGVISIGNSAFERCGGLTNITIPGNVTSIGNSAFRYCIELANITISDSVISIGNYAFSDCGVLTGVAIGDSVTSIGDYAFNECSSLTSITIPDSVASIGKYAFYNCIKLTSITMSNNVTNIGERAFQYCSSLTSITIPDSVTSIGKYAFGYCRKLKSIAIGGGVSSIGEYAFIDCSGLGNVYIGNLAAWCGIKFSNNYSNPLYYADALYLNGTIMEDIVIPDGVTSIGYTAFYKCGSLTSITIPNSVTSIGVAAFSNCSGLTDVYYCGSEEQWSEITIASSNESLKNAAIHFGWKVGPQEDPNAKFASTGLSLGEFIGLQSALMKSAINSGEFDETYFMYKHHTFDEDGNAIVNEAKGEYLDMGSYFVADCKVNAKQMSDVFEITPYYVVDGVTYYGATTTTSVKAESMNKINDAKTESKTKALCVAMLNYGAEAQKNFGYNQGSLANSELSAAQKVLPAFADLNLEKTNTIPTTPYKPASSGMSLGDVVYMQFLMPMSKVDADGSMKYQIIGEDPVEVAIADLETYGDTYYIINIPIKAKHVRTNIAIALFNAQGTRDYGYMVCSIEAFTVAKQGTSTETLAAALMAYGDAAKAVFG